MRKKCPLQITSHYFENVIHYNYITITILQLPQVCLAADLLKPVTVVVSVTVMSRVVTGFVDTVTAMSRVVTGHLIGCHGLSRVLLKLSRECNGNVMEMSQLFWRRHGYMKCTARTSFIF